MMSEPPVMRGATLPPAGRDDLVVPTNEPPLGIVLVEPRIPPNVGAISRICAAIGAPLCLVGKVTFQEDHPARRRAGLDYWPLVDKIYLDDFDALRLRYPQARLHLFSTHAERSIFEARFAVGDLLVFGSEDDGLPQALLEAHADACLRIPMVRGIRSLNLSSSVAIAAYEAVRQIMETGAGR